MGAFWKMCFRRRTRLVIGSLVLVAIALLNLAAWCHAWSMMHYSRGGVRTGSPEDLGLFAKLGVLFRGVSLPRPENSWGPSNLSPDAQSLILKTPGGVRLGAWLVDPHKTDSIVLLFHGYGAEKSGLVTEAGSFLEMGHAVLLVDFRGSGESSESYVTLGHDEAEDVATAFHYAREVLGKKRILLYGQSMGAAAILKAVADLGVDAEALILEGVYDRLMQAVQNRFRAMSLPTFPAAQLLVFWGGIQAGFNGLELNPVEYAAAVKCPVLMLHGAEDPRARPDEARRVFDALAEAKTLHFLTGLGHVPGRIHRPEEWIPAVQTFLAESFPSVSSR